ncbi:Type I restriction enzyme EcoKI specificity protein [Yersinia massiliensis]|uniref:restriction endonuclease subunit S n=1 Tax=Yersinia massiliensis TaxID=419257 RepID=UPI0005E428A6|nr:restriction endonuclease subunit S [Yersinia massiliensis]CNH31728.1 Type I restriction enzyme EcoKI specificity protein [Yersinia massiliensis]
MSDLMPKEWVLGKASDFVINPKNDIVDGPFGSNLKASEYQFSGTPIIRLQNIKRLRFIDKNIKFVSNEKADTLSRHSYKRGDIVITKLGDPLGLACIVPENFQDGIIVADLVRLRINDLVFDKKYLTYALNSPSVINQLSKHIKGTTRPRINLGIIRDLNIPITSIFEQKLIADKLDTLLAQVDSAKARLEQIPQILKRFRQAVLAMVLNGTSEQSQNPAKIVKLIDVTKKITDGEHLTPKTINSGIPLLSAKDVQEDELLFDNVKYLSDTVAAKALNRCNPEKNDILIVSRGATVGRTHLVSTSEKFCLMGSVLLIKLDTEQVIPEYMKLIFNDISGQLQLVSASGATAQQAIYIRDVKEFSFKLISLHEQHEIVSRVEQLFAYADIIEKQVNNAVTRVNNLTQSILAKAFRGELTAQWRAENPELISGENSAAALLEKIKAERAASGSKKASRKKT